MTGLFTNMSSFLLRREGCLPALPGNSTVFPHLLQANGYRNTGGMGKSEGSRERLWHASSPGQDAPLVAEAERNPFFSARDLKAATGFPGQKDTIISRLKAPGLRAQHAAVKELLTDEHQL